MSYYAGYSLKEVYKKRCAELECTANSAVVRTLPDVPDDFTSLTSLDLSRNFLGTKGVIPLLDVAECATGLRSFDLRHQELGNEAAAVICARLRRHPSLEKLNLSDNPITLAVGTELLELAKQNHVLQYIYLERTLVRPSMVTVVEVQLEKNRQRLANHDLLQSADTVTAVQAPSSLPSEAATAAVGQSRSPKEPPPGQRPASHVTDAATAAGGGAAAVASLLRTTASQPRTSSLPAPAISLVPRKRCPPHEIQHVLQTYTRAVTDKLFDENPAQDLWKWCEEHHYFFDDPQFSSRQDDVHRTARHTYGIAGWRRIGELFPQATLFGVGGLPNLASMHDATGATASDQAAALSAAAATGLLPEADSVLLQLPTDVPNGFTWTFTAVAASVKDTHSLRALLCCPRTRSSSRTVAPVDARIAEQKGTEFPGIYVMRLYAEGKWRYIVVDDFLPVDKCGKLIFTKPSLNNTVFWPCILEKTLAKLSGGYHALDSHFNEHHEGIDGPTIRKPIAWNYLSRENLQRAADATRAQTANGGEEVASVSASLSSQWVGESCGRIMSQLTSGFYDSYPLHPLSERLKSRWWELLHHAVAKQATQQQQRSSGANSAGGVRTFSYDGSAVTAVPGLHASDGSGEGHLRDTSSGKRSTVSTGRSSAAASVPNVPTNLPHHSGVVAFSRDAAYTVNGIHARTAYQVVRACHVNGVRLLMLRNLWCGAKRWSGDWADDSPLWKKNPEVAEMLLQRTSTLISTGGSMRGLSEAAAYVRGDSSVLGPQSSLKRSLLDAIRDSSSTAGGGSVMRSLNNRDSAADTSSGGSATSGSGGTVAGNGASAAETHLPHMPKSTFWLSYTDFLLNFDWVHICRVFGDEFQRRDVHHEWTHQTAGGNPHEPTWHTNPHYRLSLPNRTTLRLQLTRRDVGLHRTRGGISAEMQRGEGGIGLQLLRDAYYPLHCAPSCFQETGGSPLIMEGPAGFGNGGAAGGGRGDVSTFGNAGGRGGGADGTGDGFGAMGDGADQHGAEVFPYTSFSSLLFSKVDQIGDHLCVDITLEAGSQYWIVPTTCAARTLDQFDLAIVATSGFHLQETQESQYWDVRTVPREMLVAVTTRQVSQSDGELALLFNAHTRVYMDADFLLPPSVKKKQHGRGDSVGSAGAAPAAAPVHDLATAAALQPTTTSCRVVVAATMSVVEDAENTGDLDVDEAYTRPLSPNSSVDRTPTVALALVPGEVDTLGNPSRTIGEIVPHAACTYSVRHYSVLEAEIQPVPRREIEYYTAICSPRPAGTRAYVSYRVWCAAPLLSVRSLPVWAKQENLVHWDEEKGSGNYYDCNGHPQLELSRLQPFERFTVSLRMIDYDTIEPAIMFSVIHIDDHTGEPVAGRLATYELFARSDYVDGAEVQAGFELDREPPASLLLIPCLQPTGSHGRCIVTIYSDNPHFRVNVLCGGVNGGGSSALR